MDIKFDDYFFDQTLRIDYSHHGNCKVHQIKLRKFTVYKNWWRSNLKLLDQNPLGCFLVELSTVDSGQLIYSRSFNSYFEEFQSTVEARVENLEEFQESVYLPLPKIPVIVTFKFRSNKVEFTTLFSKELNISSENLVSFVPDAEVQIVKQYLGGGSEDSIDFAVLAEGYTQDEFVKFELALKLLSDAILNAEPYKSKTHHLNIYGIFKASKDSGVTQKHLNLKHETTLKAEYGTLGMERYVLTRENDRVQELASIVPFDQIVILLNSDRYGGGGIYGQYCTLSANPNYLPYLLLHELGHSLGGLADEYYGKSVSYITEEFDSNFEPWSPNISRLVDLANLKWLELVTVDELPTSWPKKEYESLMEEYELKRQPLLKNLDNCSTKDVGSASRKRADQALRQLEVEHKTKLSELFSNSGLLNEIGAFEGAAYHSNSWFRPALNCIMFSREFDPGRPYCKVCEQAISSALAPSSAD